jgi:coenzyme F420-reducing hydrogenase alpha subunit
VRVDTGRTYLAGPLARINLNRDQLLPTARGVFDEIGLEWPCRNPFKGILARCVELVQGYEEALRILTDYRPRGEPRRAYDSQAGEGASATEAPRGLLYHRYGVDEQGRVTAANIVPPTSQNQSQMEEDLRHYLPDVLAGDDTAVALACERLVRTYDPCISCSTHFLRVRVERE